MGLQFLYPGLAILGAAGASVPIIIHLLFKPKPKPLIFPALTLLHRKKSQTQRQIKLKHLLLLLARILLLLLLGFALARPTVKSSLLNLDQEAPAAVALIFDTSLSMQYNHEGKTRLEVAKELAQKALGDFPEGSQIYLVDSSTALAGAPLTVGSAMGQLSRVQVQPLSVPLNIALRESAKELKKSNLTRREIFVFSDLAQHAWNTADSKLADDIPENIAVYLINVGVENAGQVFMEPLQLKRQVVGSDERLDLTAVIENSSDQDFDITSLKLIINGEERATKRRKIPAGEKHEIAFENVRPAADEQEVVAGSLEFETRQTDPLLFDNARYFALRVQPTIPTLAISDDPSDRLQWVKALQPGAIRTGFDVASISTPALKELSVDDLKKYALITLINVKQLPDDDWRKLLEVTRQGKVIFFALGKRVNPESYNSELAQQLLPAKIESVNAAKPPVYLSDAKTSHPLLRPFRKLGNDFADLPVDNYWKVKAKKETHVMDYTNGDPALLERSFSKGQCILLTTSAHRRPPDDSWNELPLGWSYLVIAHQMVRYAAGVTQLRLNYMVGEQPALRRDAQDPLRYVLIDPSDAREVIAFEPTEFRRTLPAAAKMGVYRAVPEDAPGEPERGFAVNVPIQESILTPVDPDELKKLIEGENGPARCQIAEDPTKLDDLIETSRVGRELLPYLMLFVLIFFLVEGYLSNRFYQLKPADA